MSDKSLGIIIFLVGLIGSITYTFWLFWPAESSNVLFYIPGIGGRWAIVLPIFIGVIGILAIGMWVGWTMMVTPPPVMVEEEKTEEKPKA